MFAVGNSNGLLSSSATHPGPQTLPAYYIEREENLTVNGNLTVGKDISANGDIYANDIYANDIYANDISANDGLFNEINVVGSIFANQGNFDDDITVNGVSNLFNDVNIGGILELQGSKVYPQFVKINDAGTITKQTTSTIVPNSEFTIPEGKSGYYFYSAQISLTGVGDVSGANDFMTTFFDISGGSLTPINGTINTTTIVESTTDSVFFVVNGIIMQRLESDETIRMLHLESEDAGFTFTSGSIIVAYNYLGDTAL
jgi:hypothetical protein